METDLKILLAEDNINDVKLLERELSSNSLKYKLYVVKNESEYRQAIKEFCPDLILSDYSMPEFNGMTALKIRDELVPNLPFIIITGSVNEDTAVDCMKAGADDYVIKEHIHRIYSAMVSALGKYGMQKEKEKAQKELIESEEKYRTLVNNLAVGVYQTTPEGKIIQMNPAFMKLIGLIKENGEVSTAKMPENITALDLYPKTEIRDEVLKAIKDYGAVKDREMQIIDINGELKWISLSSKARFDDNGNFLWIDGVMEDISARKDYENKILEAKERAEEMNRLKSSFLSNMSHELRTPMMAILGFAELLLDSLKDANNKEMVEMIISGAKRLKNTLDMILDFSRLESEDFIEETQLHDISELTAASFSLLKRDAEVKNLGYELTVQENLFIEINSYMFSKILDHIIQNAITYTEKGRIKVITGKEKIDSENFVYVKVEDTGIGIDENKFDLIFEPFRQVSEGYNRMFEGIGLGLPVSKKYIELMKGRLKVESKLGVGTVLTVFFPEVIRDKIVNDETAGIHNVNKINDEPRTAEQQGKKKKILLVEDDNYNIIIISTLLKKIYDIDIALTGEEAVTKCNNEKYSLILLDIGLPGINGINALEKIRQNLRYEKIPAIALTAFAMREESEKFLENGCDDYISKPFEREYLIATVRKWIGKGRG